jgi:hypothetical protein
MKVPRRRAWVIGRRAAAEKQRGRAVDERQLCMMRHAMRSLSLTLTHPLSFLYLPQLLRSVPPCTLRLVRRLRLVLPLFPSASTRCAQTIDSFLAHFHLSAFASQPLPIC